MPDSPIYIDKVPPIGWLVINRPEKMNAFDSDMWDAIPENIRALEEDRNIRVIVVRGAGEEAFSAGADISEFNERGAHSGAPDDLATTRDSAFRAITDCTKPTIAMIHGVCMGGGCAIALSIDIRLASDDASFAITPARLGLGYPLSGIERAVQELGPAATRYLFLTANRIDAQKALELRLVQEIHPPADLLGATERLAGRIAANAPKTIRAARESVRQSVLDQSSRNPDKANALIAECFQSEDYLEGLRAFMEKRRPDFKDQ